MGTIPWGGDNSLLDRGGGFWGLVREEGSRLREKPRETAGQRAQKAHTSPTSAAEFLLGETRATIRLQDFRVIVFRFSVLSENPQGKAGTTMIRCTVFFVFHHFIISITFTIVHCFS